MSITTITQRETALENENARLWAELFAAREQMEKQRRVLETALEALEPYKSTVLCWITPVDAAITAIQGVLK